VVRQYLEPGDRVIFRTKRTYPKQLVMSNGSIATIVSVWRNNYTEGDRNAKVRLSQKTKSNMYQIVFPDKYVATVYESEIRPARARKKEDTDKFL
jgi:S-adenosylmethionine:tRNA-ribosyltransferase-isomerase (queuine synthetase)